MSLRNVFTLLEESASRYGDAPALHQPVMGDAKQKHTVYSWNEFRDIAREIAAGLHRLGIRKGDIVALDSETRAEFYFADFGVMASGA
ncbi:MAG: AMP-binding protein, partial [Bryobacterales bacterium]|nr:AMP-binding protein [Bryobacterales bacterium]